MLFSVVKKKLTSLKKVFPYKYMGKSINTQNNFVELKRNLKGDTQ